MMQQRPSMKSSSVNSAWQRSTLGYKERFVDDFHYNNVRVRQFPCRAVFEKALCDAFGPSFLTEDDLDGTKSCYDDEVDNDRVPDTAFTVWESSVLLGMYASRKDVWNRLIGRSKLKYTSRPIVTLELGSGTGVASLLVATNLLYTCDESVICALAETVMQLTGRVAVFAVCKLHRPQSITYFLSLVKTCFDVRHVVVSTAHEDLMASDEDFGLIELWRKKLR
eukprot:scaffold3018_cov128-Skeletonema_menzelii.AAC.2